MSVHNYSGCVFWTGAWLALYQGPGDSRRWDGSYFFLLTASCGINCKERASLNDPRLLCMHGQDCAFAYISMSISPLREVKHQPTTTVSCTGLWIGQRWIWFVHKLHAQAEPLLPELVPEASGDPHCTTLRGRGGSKTATMWLRCHQGLDCNNFSLLSISWSFTSL